MNSYSDLMDVIVYGFIGGIIGSFIAGIIFNRDLRIAILQIFRIIK